MPFYNSRRAPDVTAEPSPRSPGLLPRRARLLIENALGYAADVAQGLAALVDLTRWGLERMDASGGAESEPRSTGPAAVDLGLALRVSELERAVEALAPVRVVEKRRASQPCIVCGGVVALVLEGAPRSSGGWVNGLCAGCRTFTSAKPDSEVLP